ncbi:MAG: DUF86 domain-containing protein [Actinobacteria bacterium]|nr:DUF86 domain-containing protein [Actinomycetota bacterium]
MLAGIERLPLSDPAAFAADSRNAASAESYLRRALEVLLDLGRHIIAKGIGQGPAEYKEVAIALARAHVLDEAQGALLVRLAGCRNRLTHFYDEVTDKELYEICTQHAGDIGDLLDALLGWVRRHPQLVEGGCKGRSVAGSV